MPGTRRENFLPRRVASLHSRPPCLLGGVDMSNETAATLDVTFMLKCHRSFAFKE